MTLNAGCEMSTGSLQILVGDVLIEVVAVMTSLLQIGEGLPTRLQDAVSHEKSSTAVTESE